MVNLPPQLIQEVDVGVFKLQLQLRVLVILIRNNEIFSVQVCAITQVQLMLPLSTTTLLVRADVGEKDVLGEGIIL